MTHATYILGIDIGTTNAKGILATPDGRIVAQSTATYPLLTPHVGWVEQNPEDWWQGLVTVVRNILAQPGLHPDQIAVIAISGQGAGAVLLDKQHQPTRPAITWMDARSEAECQWMREQAQDRLLAINGKLPGPYNMDPKLIWLQKHEPEVLRRSQTVLTTTGYVVLRLTGEAVLNVSDASIPFSFDQHAGTWSDELLARFGLPRALFPRVEPSQTVIGGVTPAAAAATGLKVGTPVIAGGQDTACSGLAVGVHQAGQAMLSLGTGGSIYVATAAPFANPNLLTFSHVLPQLWYIGGTIVAFGASLAWCRQLLQHANFEELNTLAEQSTVGANGLIFLPYLSGELQPINDGNARGVFFGLSLNTQQPQLVRAVLEGVAYSIAHNLEVMQQAGAHVAELRAVGGPTRSALWCQIMADVTGKPLHVLKDNPGATLGNVLLGAAAVGLIHDAGATAAEWARIDQTYEPNRAHHAHYAQLFAIYKQLYPALKPSFDSLAAVQS